MAEEKELIILSVGGSVLAPDAIDVAFMQLFRTFLQSWISKGKRFAIVCGGGRVCRTYQQALAEMGVKDPVALDLLGISATHLNAKLLQLALGDLGSPDIVTDYTTKPKLTKPVLVCGGWKPGWSTDYDAVYLAHQLGSKQVINITNVDAIYDQDPRKEKNAKPFRELRWKAYLEMVGTTWKPGMNVPFDPKAAELAQRHAITVKIIGKNLAMLDACLSSKTFSGTTLF
ncbi:UMP kinase [Candidatus Woesearchaeota archaeon]|nr:UMP kinase [Candidatus Woesearchaeota archaeon]